MMTGKSQSLPSVVEGIVTDEAGVPLIGVTIQAENSKRQRLLNISGKFRIKLNSENNI
jgi:hypothetical protein